MNTSASNELARPDLRIALTLDIQLNRIMRPPRCTRSISSVRDGSADWGTVTVDRGHLHIIREISFRQEAALRSLVTPAGRLTIKGSFRYQACDDRKCYRPEDLPLEWGFQYEGLDQQREPVEFQRKPN